MGFREGKSSNLKKKNHKHIKLGEEGKEEAKSEGRM
jgi:hypothetical protein